MRLCSYGRDFLSPVSSRASFSRVWRAFCAARRRWPSGRLSVSLRGGLCVRWLVPGGVCPPGGDLCGLLLA